MSRCAFGQDPCDCGPCYDLCSCKHCWRGWTTFPFHRRLWWRICEMWRELRGTARRL